MDARVIRAEAEYWIRSFGPELTLVELSEGMGISAAEIDRALRIDHRFRYSHTLGAPKYISMR